MTLATSTPAYPEPETTPTLIEADARLLHSVLIKGEQAIARQKDMVEMHKRIVSMFTTLNAGLGEQQAKKASEDRKVVERKLEAMEHAVNGMEAVLRIEMPPQLEHMLDEALDRRDLKQKPRRFPIFGMILAISIGLLFGMNYSEALKDASVRAIAQTGISFDWRQ